MAQKTERKAKALAEWIKKNDIPMIFLDEVFLKAKKILEEKAAIDSEKSG